MFVLFADVVYICNVFFMVLDLWLGVKIGCRETAILILKGFEFLVNSDNMFVETVLRIKNYIYLCAL